MENDNLDDDSRPPRGGGGGAIELVCPGHHSI